MSPELGRRIAFTLGALLVYRIGSNIPLPGIDLAAWFQIYGAGHADLLTTALAGGSLHRVAIFALGILPYITAAVLIQLATVASSNLQSRTRQGYRGRKTILACTRALTLFLVVFQAYGIAVGLEGVHGVVANPGTLFKLSTVLTLTAGTMSLMWLADQITARGIGNGIAIILAAGFLAELPSIVAGMFELGRQGVLSTDLMLGMAVMAAAVVALIVFVEGARRWIMVDYPKRDIGGRTIDAVSTPLALKLNNAGVIPTFLANWVLVLPVAFASFALGPNSVWGGTLLNQLKHGRPLFLILFCAMIVLFSLIYTAFLLDPESVSETLKTHGGELPGIAPGEPTAAYFDNVVSRITILAGVYLAFVFIVPELLIAYFRVPFYLGGQAFLIVVCAILDIGAQYKQQMQLQPGGYTR